MHPQSTPASPVVYRPVAGFLDYRVGDDGSVWSRRPANGRGGPSRRWRLLAGGKDKDGYRKVILCDGAKRRYVRVNVLVLETFIGPCPPGMLSAHENGTRDDNRLGNLRWDTQAGNVADKRRHGTHQAGETSPNHKLTENDVRAIRRRRAAGETGRALAREYGVAPCTISAVMTRRLWSHVPAEG